MSKQQALFRLLMAVLPALSEAAMQAVEKAATTPTRKTKKTLVPSRKDGGAAPSKGPTPDSGIPLFDSPTSRAKPLGGRDS